jgi:hypothetical protein
LQSNQELDGNKYCHQALFYCHIVTMDFGVLAAMVQADRDIFEVCIL